MSIHIATFDRITAQDVPLVGGKGANLGEMTRAGLPVPPGFCVTADAYRAFTAHSHETIVRLLNETRMDDTDDVETKTALLREYLIAQTMPDEIGRSVLTAYAELTRQLGGTDGTLPVAVRSSATAEDLPDASFAGQQDTYLNIRGDEQLLAHVKRCWASLWTARAVTYRHKQGYAHDQVALAVVVQAMIESEVAGILFTANPVNSSRNEMVLNASWGLGEAIVSGLVTPDTWIANKNGEILEREIATKDLAIEYEPGGGTREIVIPPPKCNYSCLSDAQVTALLHLGERVEQHYARPMDIEWAYAREAFYMLQARPITTLAQPSNQLSVSGVQSPVSSLQSPVSNLQSFDSAQDKSLIPSLQSLSGEYNRTMFVEIFPDPLSPSFLSVITPLFHSMLDFTFETLGFQPPNDIPAIGTFYNQPYFHREYIKAAFRSLSPQVQEALVTQIVNPFGKHERKLPTEASAAFLGMVTRLLSFMTGFPKQLPALLAAYRTEIEKFDALPFATLSDREIMARVRILLFDHASKLLNYDFLMIALIGITYQMLGSLLDRYYGAESEQVRAKLISGVTGNVTMETNKKIWTLAQEAKRSPTVRALLSSPLPVGEGLGVREGAAGVREGAAGVREGAAGVREGAAGVREGVEGVRSFLAQDPDGRVFLAEFDAFLEQYGHREVRMDILYPTWREDPTPVLQFIRGYFDADDKASPFVQQARLVGERERLAQEVDEHVKRDLTGRFAVAPLFHWVLRNTQTHTRERDTMHFELTRLFPPLRRGLVELGKRWSDRDLMDAQDDIFFLTIEEMQGLVDMPVPMQVLVRERRAEFERNTLRTPPSILRDGVPVESSQAATADGENLRGVAGSPGIVSGIVRIIRGPHEFEKLKRGEILVAPLTNPVWTPLFAIAGGIITQVGGILSHGAIVAREYGIPAVMAVHDATRILRDGQKVTVDGNKGTVHLQENTEITPPDSPLS